MKTYVLRRFLQMIPLLFGISALTFILLQLAPGDFLNQMAENPAISPATIDAMRRNFGLDQPWYIQYGLYLRNILLHFDFGESFSRHQPVFQVISQGLANPVARIFMSNCCLPGTTELGRSCARAGLPRARAASATATMRFI